MGLLDFVDLGCGDVFIFAAEVQHDRAAWLFGCVFRDLATVVADGRGGMQARRSEPRESAPETKSNDTYFCDAGNLRGVRNGRGDVEEGFVDADLRCDLHAARAVRGIVVEFEAGLHAIEKRRRESGEPFVGVIIHEVANVTIDAEDFLNDNDGRGRRIFRARKIGAQRMAVGRAKLWM